MTGLPTIASLWIGGDLSFIEQVCLRSFAAHGHRTILYTYDKVSNCPPGVEQMDANLIFPSTDFIRHEISGSPAIHADAFRYRMIAVQNVIWVDADILCMQPWNFKDQWVFGWEKTGKLVCNAVLGLPRFSRTLERLNRFCEDEYPIPPWADDEERRTLEAAATAGNPVHVSALKWGVWGPSALTHFLNETGEIEHVQPQMAFYQISFKERRDLLQRGRIVEGKIDSGCYGVHLWNRRLSRRLVTHEAGVPHPDSFLGRALTRYDIDPSAAPIPDRPPKGLPTQDELAKQGLAAKPARHIPAQQETAIVMPVAAIPKPEEGRLIQSPHFQEAIDNLDSRTSELVDRLEPLAVAQANDNIVVLTSMKNEAPFILEWVAYHLAIGVKHFLVYTNDCTDNTTDILDRLSELGIVTRVPNPWDPSSGKKPQHVALDDALRQPVLKKADWVLTIDVDEFVNIHVGDGTFADLFKAAGDPNVISFTWKFFGNDGIDAYEDRPIIEQFTACAPEFIPKPRLGWGFKSMLHKSAPYRKIGVHRPLKIEDESQVDQVRWVNGSGRKMPEMLLTNNGWRSTKRSLGYRLATLNHYVLRSADSFLVKRDRGRINHTEQDQGIDYWTRRNYASETDTRMHNRLPALRVELDRLMADPELSRLHQTAVVWHKQKIEDLKAQPDYAALYRSLTEVAHPDAIYLTKPEQEDSVPDSTQTLVQIPEPELLTMSEDQIAAKLQLLADMLNGKITRSELAQHGAQAERNPDAARTQHRTDQPSPELSPSQSGATKASSQSGAGSPEPGMQSSIPTKPASALETGIEPRFGQARDHAIKNKGFFWEGPENALYFEPVGKKLVVTFDNIHVVREDQPRWPWGYEFITKKLGCSVLGVMASKRNWFRQQFVHDSFDLLRDSGFFAQFEEILFYGASMGGFGALIYAKAAPGARILAIAPQSTLDRRILPDDNRWGWTARLDWDGRYADAAEGTATAKDVLLFADPYFAPDVAQMARFSGDNIRRFHMPFFGHQLPNALVNMGILAPIVTEILDGEFTKKRFYQLMRARRDLPRYQHDLLMKAEEKNHPKLAIQVCEYTLKKRNAQNIRRSLERLRARVAQSER
ncbi:MAG: glycosyltransferase family 2 protein [Loktanella sp.]|nr:glycosyltransferase family 2 protein [Loktanella sp.]